MKIDTWRKGHSMIEVDEAVTKGHQGPSKAHAPHQEPGRGKEGFRLEHGLADTLMLHSDYQDCDRINFFVLS